MKLLQMNHVKKSFNDETLHVLKDISLSVEKGEVVAIIGPSGGGKSTFLRCLNLLEQPTSGQIQYIDLGGSDTAVVYSGEPGLMDKAVAAVKEGALSLWEYFR